MHVLSLCEYLTERGVSLAPDHFGPWNVVHAIKLDKPLTGYFDVVVDGKPQRICKGQENVAIEWAAEQISSAMDFVLNDENVAVVPVPSSSCTGCEAVAQTRGFAFATSIARRFHGNGKQNAIAVPLLYWKQPKLKAQHGGTRDKDELKALLCSNPSNRPLLAGRTIVLVDDVVTTGGSLMACTEYLRSNGYDVEEMAYAAARTVHVKGQAIKTLVEDCPRADDRPSLF